MRTRIGVLLIALAAVAVGVWLLRPPTFEEKGVDEWVELLGDGTGSVAREARKSFRGGKERAVPVLRAILARGDEVNEGARNKVVITIGEIGWAAKDAVPDLLRLLEDPAEAEVLRRNAAMSLRLMKPAAARLVDPLLRSLEDASGSIRAASVNALAHLAPPDERVVPALVAAMNDPNAGVRTRACYAFYSLKTECPAAVPVLIVRLGDEDPKVRKHAAQALPVAGPKAAEAVPALILVLRDPDGFAAQQAATSLIEMDVAGKELENELLRAMDHPAPETRKRLAWVLREKIQRDRAPEFAHVPDWTDAALRRGAAAFLGLSKDPRVAQLLLVLLKDPDAGVRQAAARALGEAGTPSALPVGALIDALSDSDARVRTETAITLSRIDLGSRDLLPILANSLAGTAPETRVRALEALRLLPVSAEGLRPVLSKSLADDDAWARLTAAQGLVQIDPDDAAAIEVLAALLAKEDDAVRRRAANVLADLGPSALPALPALLVSLKSHGGDWTVPEIRAIGAIGREAKSAVGYLADAFCRVLNRHRVFETTEALERVGASEEIVAGLLLHALFESRFPEARKAAAVLLLDRAPEKARKDAKKLLTSEDPEMRKRAAEALAVLGEASDRRTMLLRHLSDPDAKVRADAALELYLFTDERTLVVPALRNALEDPDAVVRTSAAAALAGHGEDVGWPLLVKALGRPGTADDGARIRAGAALEILGRQHDRAIAILIEALAHERPETRITAARALLRLGQSGRRALPAKTALERLLNDNGIAEYSDGTRARVRDMARRALKALNE